jgi:hypothetical protein
MSKHKRPKLHRVELTAALPIRPGLAYATMSPGQWDAVLQDAYDAGFVLLEVNQREQVIAAYRRHGVELGPAPGRN